MGAPSEAVPAFAADPVLGIVIGTEFARSLVETMRMASAVLTESIDEQMLPVYDQAWLSNLAETLDRSARIIQPSGPCADD